MKKAKTTPIQQFHNEAGPLKAAENVSSIAGQNTTIHLDNDIGSSKSPHGSRCVVSESTTITTKYIAESIDPFLMSLL